MSAVENTVTITFIHREGEVGWISRDDDERMIEVYFASGVTREMSVPAGEDFDARMTRIYDSVVREYIGAGWIVNAVMAAAQRKPEPWEIADPLTAPCPF